MTGNLWELKPESLRAECDVNTLGFETTADLTPLRAKVVAQDRAQRALQFGLGIKEKGFNIFVAGVPGTGRTTAIERYLEVVARDAPVYSRSLHTFSRVSFG